jgi:hypothetical protein
MTQTRIIISAAFLILAAGQCGCSRSDDSQSAVREAGRQFETVAVGNANSSTSNAAKAYSEAEELNSKFAGPENGYTQAAALSVAQAKIGQASLASQDASLAEAEAIRLGRVIRGHINEWLTMSAIAQAAGTFDPTSDLKELAELITMRQEDIVTYRTLQDRIGTEIAQLESIISELEMNASNERNEGATIELQIPNVSATEGAVLAERVREHTLRGDQYGLEAVRVQGRVEQLRPTAEEYALNVGKAQSQIELLDKSREELQERERSSMADAAEARAMAQSASDSIVRLANELADYRSSEVQSANAKATTLAQGAISATRDSKKATASIASLTKASASQILAECLGRVANGHAEAAIIYNAIAEAGVPGDWAARIEQEHQQQSTALEDSQRAYQDAASALRGARLRGESGEKLDASAARLDLLGGVEPEPEYTEEYDEEPLEDEFVDESGDDGEDDEAEAVEDDG